MAERIVAPDVCMYNDENCESLNIQVDLPGVKKEDIEFNFLGEGFYIIANAGDITFKGAFALPGPVDPEKALGGFSDETLIVNVPYKRTSEKSIRLKID
ncbi:MAG: Hsp20/alpha crystallin family protein [Methanotrichaceae archaeon]